MRKKKYNIFQVVKSCFEKDLRSKQPTLFLFVNILFNIFSKFISLQTRPLSVSPSFPCSLVVRSSLKYVKTRIGIAERVGKEKKSSSRVTNKLYVSGEEDEGTKKTLQFTTVYSIYDKQKICL